MPEISPAAILHHHVVSRLLVQELIIQPTCQRIYWKEPMSISNSQPDTTRLQTLTEEYRLIIKQMQQPSAITTTGEMDALASERSLLHDDIIAEFARLGHPVGNRAEARERAFNLESWLREVGYQK